MGRQLSSVAATLAAVADGDLSRQAEVHGRDELGGMAAAVNRANATITDLVQQLERQEERFRSLVQHASDITAVVSPGGPPDLRQPRRQTHARHRAGDDPRPAGPGGRPPRRPAVAAPFARRTRH